ncbi:MAG: hypothetical protein V7701_00045 [Sneathiella sp.]
MGSDGEIIKGQDKMQQIYVYELVTPIGVLSIDMLGKLDLTVNPPIFSAVGDNDKVFYNGHIIL